LGQCPSHEIGILSSTRHTLRFRISVLRLLLVWSDSLGYTFLSVVLFDISCSSLLLLFPLLVLIDGILSYSSFVFPLPISLIKRFSYVLDLFRSPRFLYLPTQVLLLLLIFTFSELCMPSMNGGKRFLLQGLHWNSSRPVRPDKCSQTGQGGCSARGEHPSHHVIGSEVRDWQALSVRDP
jgi:hypothetical protein